MILLSYLSLAASPKAAPTNLNLPQVDLASRTFYCLRVTRVVWEPRNKSFEIPFKNPFENQKVTQKSSQEELIRMRLEWLAQVSKPDSPILMHLKHVWLYTPYKHYTDSGNA